MGFHHLAPEFIENVERTCGDRGVNWLRSLPELVREFENRWNVSADPPFLGLSYNYVAPAHMADGTEGVLKLGLPVDDGEMYSEADYLRLLNGDRAVELLEEDREFRAMLLRRVRPGIDLKRGYRDDPEGAVDVAVELLAGLVREVPDESEFIKLPQWTGFLKRAGEFGFPSDKAERALEIFNSADPSMDRLLHGDFHHTNILSAGATGFVSIDPKGIVASPAYDIAVFLNNHRGWIGGEPQLKEKLDGAVAKFAAAFGYSGDEIRHWAFAQKVLGSFWTMTENGPRWREQLASADIWEV